MHDIISTPPIQKIKLFVFLTIKKMTSHKDSTNLDIRKTVLNDGMKLMHYSHNLPSLSRRRASATAPNSSEG